MALSESQSSRLIIDRLKAGDTAAAQQVFERYWRKVVDLAGRQLGGWPRRDFSSQDVAQSVFASLCNGAQKGRFPRLADGHDLWSLLVALTKHKAADQIKKAKRKKRGGGKVRGESAFGKFGSDGRPMGIAAIVDEEPTPELIAEAGELIERLFKLLDEEDAKDSRVKLSEVTLQKLDGFTNGEIASKFDVVERTIERKLERIRLLWVASRFEELWKSGDDPCIKDFLVLVDGKDNRERLFSKLLPTELKYRRKKGESPAVDEYRNSFPEFVEVINFVFDNSGPQPKM